MVSFPMCLLLALLGVYIFVRLLKSHFHRQQSTKSSCFLVKGLSKENIPEMESSKCTEEEALETVSRQLTQRVIHEATSEITKYRQQDEEEYHFITTDQEMCKGNTESHTKLD